MAHYLAELINKAENASTESERLSACKEAVKTIIKLWEHRTSLPGKAYPLKSYQNILLILDKLQPGSNPFRYFVSNNETGIDQYAVNLFDSFSRLIIALLLMKLPSHETSEEADPVVLNTLSETEQYLLSTIQQWSLLFAPMDEKFNQKQKKESDLNKMALAETAMSLIDDTIATLVELRKVLQEMQR